MYSNGQAKVFHAEDHWTSQPGRAPMSATVVPSSVRPAEARNRHVIARARRPHGIRGDSRRARWIAAWSPSSRSSVVEARRRAALFPFMPLEPLDVIEVLVAPRGPLVPEQRLPANDRYGAAVDVRKERRAGGFVEG
jgi:hypothetical protein